jgi:Zn-dependent peptidase ImmA (M78 family)
MTPDPHQWLLRRAVSLSRDSTRDLKAIVNELGISVVKNASVGNGDVRKLVDGRYEIRVPRAPVPQQRTRFTVAHELGHILLDQEWGLRPSSAAEYWRHERWCDDFAGVLLVPVAALAAFDRDNPIESSRLIADRCRVSLPVVATRAVADATDMAFIDSRLERNVRGERVLRVTTLAGSLLKAVRPNQHLRRASRIGRTALAFVDGQSWRTLADVYFPKITLQFLRRGDAVAIFGCESRPHDDV